MIEPGAKRLAGFLAAIATASALAVTPVGAVNTPNQATSATSADYYEDGAARFDRGDFGGAIVQLKNALQEQPGYLAARILIGRAYVEIGDGAAAEKELSIALGNGGDETLIVVPFGQSLMMQHKYAELLEAVRPGTRAAELEAEIHMMRGKSHVALRNLDAAESEYAAARDIGTVKANALLGLAEVAMYRRDMVLAERLIAEALELDPNDADAWSLDGDYKRSRGDLPGAVVSYDRAIALQPVHVETRRSRATVLIALDKASEAQKDVDYLLDLLPEDPQSIYLNALIMGRNGNLEGGTAELWRADSIIRSYDVSFTRKHLPTLLIAGVINYRLNESDVALSYLEQYLRYEPQHIGARRMVATLYSRRGDDERAVRVLRPVVGPDARDARLLAQFGTALMRSGQHSEAGSVLERAIALAPGDAQLHTSRALNEIAVGNNDQAIAGLEAALDRHADTLEHAVLLGLMHLRRNDYDRALTVANDLQTRHPDNPFGFNLAGAAIWGKGDETAARGRFEAAVGLDPGYAPAHINLAKLDMRSGNDEAAEVRLLSLVDRGLGGNEPFIALASIAERRGNFAAAISWLGRINEASESGPGTQVQLVNLHLRAEKYEEALLMARKLEAIFPDHLSVVEAVGRAAVAARDTEMAFVKYRRMAELAWESPTELNRIAALQQQAGDSQGAYTTLWRAVSIEPTYLPAQASLVRYDASRGQFAKALERANQVRELFPELATGDLLAGDVHMQAKHYAEAVAAYELGLAKQEDGVLLLRLYLARREVGDEGALVEMLQEWLDRHPDDAVVKRTLAGEYARLDRLDEAVTLNEQLLEELPDDPVVLNNLAWLYQETGRSDALRYAERAYELAPTQVRTIDTLGWILVQEGDVRRGLGLLRDAQARAANDASINFHVAVALSKLGRTEDARAQLEALLSEGGDESIAVEARALLKTLSGG